MKKCELRTPVRHKCRGMMEEDIEDDGVEFVPLNLDPAPAPPAKRQQIEPLVRIHAHTLSLDYVFS